MLESVFQASIIKKLDRQFPGCVVLKNDANYIQGFPDLLVLYGEKWVALEIKKSKDSSYRPNQEWWLAQLSEMSFATTIFPENEEEIFICLHDFFG